MKFLIVLCVLIAIGYTAIIPEQHTGVQSIKVKGKLLCGTEPAKDVRVKLVDDDFGPDPDDDLDSGYTNADGTFELAGDTTEMTTIDPHLKIYHDCTGPVNVVGNSNYPTTIFRVERPQLK